MLQIIKPSVTICLCRTTRGQHSPADGRSDKHEFNKSSKGSGRGGAEDVRDV